MSSPSSSSLSSLQGIAVLHSPVQTTIAQLELHIFVLSCLLDHGSVRVSDLCGMYSSKYNKNIAHAIHINAQLQMNTTSFMETLSGVAVERRKSAADHMVTSKNDHDGSRNLIKTLTHKLELARRTISIVIILHNALPLCFCHFISFCFVLLIV